MRYLVLLRTLFVFVVIMGLPHITLADDDLNFVYNLCIQGMSSEPSITRAESETFCSCAIDEVKKGITQGQRSSIRELKRLMKLNQAVPQDLFQKSGLKGLIVKSQDHCSKLQWPVASKISEKDHKKYSSMATRSVVEFDALLGARCDKYPKSKERNRCLVDAAKEWLKTKGKHYAGIPPAYLTGNDLAKAFIDKAQ